MLESIWSVNTKMVVYAILPLTDHIWSGILIL
jgi:hypothetical protein